MPRATRLAIAFACLFSTIGSSVAVEQTADGADHPTLAAWRSEWDASLTRESTQMRCETKAGEESGWEMSPLLGGFYYGYLATGDTKWIDRLINCADAWIGAAVREPDGYLGWPELGASGTPVDHLDRLDADSLVGEAMALRPIVLLSGVILSSPTLHERYGSSAAKYIGLAEEVFKKWDERGAWRDTDGGGMISIVPPFGIDRKAMRWTAGYDDRKSHDVGFSHPDNKANLVATWLLAMYDVTKKSLYRERAAGWFRLMKTRMSLETRQSGTLWNYWEPAGEWDYGHFGVPKHWVGVHPNAGYYMMDVDCVVDAYEHGVVFNETDLQRLIAISIADDRYWPGLARYSAAMERKIEELNKPDSWAGLTTTPWYLALRQQKSEAGLVP
jgi:hypothetical protein